MVGIGGSSVPAGSQALIPATMPSNSSAKLFPVTFRFALPQSAVPQAAGRGKRDAGFGGGFVSAAFTPTISLTVTPLGGSPAGPYTSTCTSGTSGYCTVAFTAAPGPTTFSGTLSENGNVVSRFSQLQIVQPSAANTISFTANPVVDSVTLQLSSSSVNAGTPNSVTLSVLAKDANGNTIAGSAPYIDANGNPLSLTLDISNIQAGGGGRSTLQGPARITAPGQAPISVNYDGRWLESSTISVRSTSSVMTNVSGVTLGITPFVYEYSNGITPGAQPFQICSGPDGNVWFTYTNATKLGRITPSGLITEFSTGISQNTGSCTVGANGNLWFSESNITSTNGSLIGQIAANGTVTEYTGLPSNGPRGITAGPDGRIWTGVEYSGTIGAISPSAVSTTGSIKQYPITTNNQVDMISGPDGNIWFTQYAGAIGVITPLGTFKRFTVGIPTGASQMTLGPDGNVWVAFNGNGIGKITPTGTMTPYTAGITGSPNGIVTGPDGNVWYVTQGTRIGRITPSGTPTEWTNGFTAGATSYWLARGPDGNLWFTDTANRAIGKFVY